MPSPALGSMSPGLSGMSPALTGMEGAHMSPGMAPMKQEDYGGMHGQAGPPPMMGGRARGPPPMGDYRGQGGHGGMQAGGGKPQGARGYGGAQVPQDVGGWDPVPRQSSNDMYYEGGGDSAGWGGGPAGARAGELRWSREDAQGGLGVMAQGTCCFLRRISVVRASVSRIRFQAKREKH